MNRAERRRQKNKTRKAAKNSNSTPSQQASAIQQFLDLAIRHHKAGDLTQAEGFYQQVIQADPNQPVALNMLGLIANQLGKHNIAVEFFTKALAFQPGLAEGHFNLGNALRELGRLEDAVTSYSKALAIKPDYTEAYGNLGLALQKLGKLDEAVTRYQKAIAINPDADAYNNLGIALRELGKLEDAVDSYHKALAINPDLAEAHNNLGLALRELGRLEDAVASYSKALAIKPDYADALGNLGLALIDQGKMEEAFTYQRRAIALNPENDLFWIGLAASIETLSFTSVEENLLADLLHLLEHPMVHVSDVVRPIVSVLHHHPNFAQIIKITNSGKPAIGVAYPDVFEELLAIPLLLRVMGLSPIYDLKIERMLTVLRCALIQMVNEGDMDERTLSFSTTLALQCFTNEYVFPETEEENAAVEHLHKQIATLVDNGRDVPPSLLITLASYRPLYRFPWAQELCEREWTNNVREVIDRQITEPEKEQSLRSQIPRLTPIEDKVSQSVREQYEENPYPRWFKAGIQEKGKDIGAVLREAPLRLDLGDYQSPENPEILIAGCGTGQHALITASRFSGTRVLAVDLSLSSLSYALRKTKELEFSNIEYAQGDIMELGSLERQFDLIESVGVLHHLGDPLAGWQVLANLLRPDGLMRIGLYSETARQDIISGRSLIAEEGYTSSTEDIRRSRQDIITKAEGGNPEMAKICSLKDFFSLSDYRDLIFHVQEHRFTLTQIDAALQDLKLKFLGFEMRDQKAQTLFRKSHPEKGAQTSLALWHTFEIKNPNTFRGMYQFWCQKM